ncbi:MAG: hypothetical protein CMI59_00160 [Parvibaculum sp.]|nr:hypothetical protein [Parvibaculum sp.]
MVIYSATGAESLSLGLKPVTETGRSPLTLLLANAGTAEFSDDSGRDPVACPFLAVGFRRDQPILA